MRCILGLDISGVGLDISEFGSEGLKDRESGDRRESEGIKEGEGKEKDKGFFYDGVCGLGHRRLSILDLSEEANQPMYSQNGRYAIVFNGEIYNYREIRRELIELGIRFSTQSDTEVLLYALIQHPAG